MKKIILMTMLMSAVFAQRGWEAADLSGADLTNAKLANVKLPMANLEGAYLANADLERANLTDAILEGVRSSRIIGKPASLPKGWSLVDGRLIKKDGE